MGRPRRFKSILPDTQDSLDNLDEVCSKTQNHMGASSAPLAHSRTFFKLPVRDGATSIQSTRVEGSFVQSFKLNYNGTTSAQSNHHGTTSAQSTHHGTASSQSNHNGAHSEPENTNIFYESEDEVTLTSRKTINKKTDGYWRVSLIVTMVTSHKRD